MRTLFNLVSSILLAPFKLVKFVVVDVLIVGVIGGIFSTIKSIGKLVFKPFSLILIAGAAAAFYFASDEQKKKIKALIGI